VTIYEQDFALTSQLDSWLVPYGVFKNGRNATMGSNMRSEATRRSIKQKLTKKTNALPSTHTTITASAAVPSLKSPPPNN